MSRVRAVVDTNVLVSGVISRGALHRVLLAWLRGAFQLVAAQALYDEIEAVLHRPRIRERYRISDAEVALLLQRLSACIESSHSVTRLGVEVRDPEDEHVLAAAVDGQVEYLVTGDNDLLALRDHPAVAPLRVVTVHEFLAVLADEAG